MATKEALRLRGQPIQAPFAHGKFSLTLPPTLPRIGLLDVLRPTIARIPIPKSATIFMVLSGDMQRHYSVHLLSVFVLWVRCLNDKRIPLMKSGPRNGILNINLPADFGNVRT
jgi:hypothetical protein